MKKRYNFMDALRILCMAGIVYYHMIFALYLDGIRQLESVCILFQNSNMHIAKVGVGIFFMISGAGLMLSTKDSGKLDLIKYYKKRFLKILVPFYLVYILYLSFFMIMTGETLQGVYNRIVPPFNIIFTILGMDAYLSSFGVPTYSLGIGEWFLGALVMMYIIFPVLRYFLLKNKWLTLLFMTIYYVIILITYPYMSYAVSNPGYVNFTVKIYEFFLGMFLILIIDKIPKYISIGITVPILLFYLLYPNTLPINDNIMILMQNVSIFLLFSGMEAVFIKIPKVMKVVAFLCGYTYEFFLIHHVVIDYMTLQVVGRPYTNKDILILFLMELMVISLLTVLVKLVLAIPSYIRKGIGQNK